MRAEAYGAPLRASSTPWSSGWAILPISTEVSPRLKNVLWMAIYPTFVWGVIIFIVAFVLGYFKDGDHETLRDVVLAISVPLVLAHAAASAYALIWVIRKLGGRRRLAWIAGFWVGGSLGVMAWWWMLVRPLPEPQ
jgi:hypothetical protein